MQQTMRNNNIGTTSKDTKGELEAGQDLPGGGIKNTSNLDAIKFMFLWT